jgi:hypothetical protein
MQIREITLADGRYLIFYTFDDEIVQVEEKSVSLEIRENDNVGTSVEPATR